MKNLILPIAIGIVLLTACSKDESLEQTELQTTDSVYILNHFDETSNLETMVLDSPQNGVNYASELNISYRDHTDGLFMSAPQYGMTLQWTGTQTEHGPSGSAEFKQITPYINLHFKMKTECISIEGNEAVYGGTITQVISATGNAPIIEEGWRYYFKVIDNVERGLPGGIVPNDQLSNRSIFAPPGIQLLCNGYPPSSYIWSSLGYTEVLEPGFVKVVNYVVE